MSEGKRIVLINGSPKVDRNQSNSDRLVSMQEEAMKAAGFDIYKIDIRYSLAHNRLTDDFSELSHADAVVIAFPLYIFSLPGMVMRYLQDYDQFLKEQGNTLKCPKIYAFVNCGFTETDINVEAFRVLRSFSRQIGAEFRFGVSVGGGGLLSVATDAPFMKKTFSELDRAFHRVIEDITESGSVEIADIMVEVKIPNRLYYYFATKGWYQSARSNNLKKKDLYRQPYYQKSKI